MKINNYKITTIILLVVIVGLISYNIYESTIAEYTMGDFKISKANFDKMVKELPQGVYKLCNIDNTQCIKLYQDMLK